MKNLITFFLILTTCLFSKINWSQSFKWTDTTFQEGDKFINNDIIFKFDSDKFISDSIKFVDELAKFCISNPNLIIEIGCHSDGRGSDSYSTNLSAKRAESIKSYLLDKGIQKSQVISKGYRWSQLLISNEEINKLKTDKEKENAHQKNRRIEITILKIEMPQNFKFTDKVFIEGQSLSNSSIRYDYNKAILTNLPNTFLDSLVDFCLINNNLTIEIRYHRDSRGSDIYSTDLTTARAKCIKSYLIQNGVIEENIIAKGYGETQLLISDEEIKNLKTQEEKEKAHQKNRRVEIFILKID